METCSFSISSLPLQSPPSFHKSKHLHYLAKPLPKPQKRTAFFASLNSPKGFGPSPRKTNNPKKDLKKQENKDEENEIVERREADVIPEIVTNRMIKRMGFSVGIPLFIGLMFFPLFYYLKVGLKVDVPSWVPVIVSFVFFGTALLGVSYGIVSSSWDPMREGSALGWIEAQKNWPVFWQSIRGGSDSRKR
ncbi:hypothetical protein AgCh_037015 [Apium graveolens]